MTLVNNLCFLRKCRAGFINAHHILPTMQSLILIGILCFNLQGVQFHPESIITTQGKAMVHNFIKLIERQEAEGSCSGSGSGSEN